MAEDTARTFPGVITYEALQAKHEEYDAEYWGRLRALYEGGKCLFDSEYFAAVFPQHLDEHKFIYNERKSRAFYINYAGEIIDHIAAALMVHPVQVSTEEKHDEFYERFVEDVSPRGGKRLPLHRFVWKQVRDALVFGRVWTIVDFPPNVEYLNEEISEAAQREAGALEGYALCIEPEVVFDWEKAPDGELLWVKLCTQKMERSFDGASNLVTKDYTIYRPNDWARYSVTYRPDQPPQDKDEVRLVDAGPHSFERVPVLPFELPKGLWAMNKLESLAREHFNKRAALAWAEYKSLFQERYEFLSSGEETCLDGIGEDQARAVNQVRGQGYTQVRDKDDRVEYVGPDANSYTFALQSTNSLRDEMHRVTHQMALAADNSASSLRRSGDSKQEDKKDTIVVLNALGQFAREYVYEIMDTMSVGRADELTWIISGLDEYDAVDVSSLLQQATVVKDIDIPSPTFKKKYKFELAKSVLGEKVPPEVLQTVEEELNTAFKDEKPMTAEQRMLEQMQEAPGALGGRFAQDPLKNRDNRNQEKEMNNERGTKSTE